MALEASFDIGTKQVLEFSTINPDKLALLAKDAGTLALEQQQPPEMTLNAPTADSVHVCCSGSEATC